MEGFTLDPIIRILHLEDDPADAYLIEAALTQASLGGRIVLVHTREAFETALREGGIDIVLADYELPMYDGMTALRLTLARCPEIPSRSAPLSISLKSWRRRELKTIFLPSSVLARKALSSSPSLLTYPSSAS